MKTAEHTSLTKRLARPAGYLILSGLISVLPFLFREIYFMEPDDYLLNYIANGSYGFEDSQFLVYIKLPIGYILKLLYSITGRLNWYGAFLGGILVLSFWVIFLVLQKMSDSVWPVVCAAALEVTIPTYFFSYTVIAFLTDAAALLLLYGWYRGFHRKMQHFKARPEGPHHAELPEGGRQHGARPEGPHHAEFSKGGRRLGGRPEGSPRPIAAFAGALLLWLGYCLRSDALIPTLGVFFPLFVWEVGEDIFLLFRARREAEASGSRGSNASESGAAAQTGSGKVGMRGETDRRCAGGRILTLCAAFAAAFLMIAVTQFIESRAYSAEPWGEFTAFNEARTGIVDRPAINYHDHPDAITDSGMTTLDYELIYNWKFADKDTFNIPAMTQVGEAAKDFTSVTQRKNYAKGAITPFGKWILVLPLLVWLILLVTGGIGTMAVVSGGGPEGGAWRRISVPLCALCTVGMAAALDVALLFIRMRFVHRVSVPIAFAAVLALLAVSTKTPRGGRRLPAAASPQAGEDGRHKGESIAAALPRAGDTGVENSEKKRFGQGAIGCFLRAAFFLILTVTFVRHAEASFPARPYGSPVYQGARAEIAAHKDRYYVIDGYVLSMLYYYDHPVSTVLYTDTFTNIARSGSWDSFSGRYYRQAERFIADPDNLLTSLATEDCTRFISLDATLVHKYLEEQTGRAVEMEEAAFDDGQIKMYAFH